MKTLYDLLDVRPDDDAEGLKQAFRKAVKASHPDIHTDDPDATRRFRHFVQAYNILRDPELRADYDRLLELEREQLRSNSYTMRKFVSDAIVIAGLAVVMVGGYSLYTHISNTFVEAVAVVEVPARGPLEIAAVEPAARADTTERDEPRDKLVVPDMATAPSAVASADTRGEAPETADGGPASSSAGPDTEVAKIANAFDAPVNQTGMTTAADGLKENSGIGPLDQKKARSIEVQSSSLEKDGDVPTSSSSAFATSCEKRDMKTREMKTHEGPRMVAKRQATNHTPGKQVPLVNRNTSACSDFQTCSGRVPPLFGVGF
jgi:DnaJ domain